MSPQLQAIELLPGSKYLIIRDILIMAMVVDIFNMQFPI